MAVKFDNPPINERVLGVQFDVLPFYTDAYAGWFWKNWLDEEWDSTNQAAPIQDRFERFDQPRPVTLESYFSTSPVPERAQFRRSRDRAMIQIQNSRFHYNWTKTEGSDYVEFSDVLASFENYLSSFRDFITAASAGRDDSVLNINQWEVTYVNQISKGDLWETSQDWERIFPSLIVPNHESSELDSLSMSWASALPNKVGRLHTTFRTALTKADNKEIINLEFTCRGPISEEVDYAKGLQIGHDEIVSCFVAMTTAEAQKFWEKTE